MASSPTVYAWEHFPEYIATQQYSRCLGRIFGSLPRRAQRRFAKPLTRAAMLMAMCIVGAHADQPPPPARGPTREDRENFREIGLQAVDASRDGLRILKDAGLGSRADLAAATELLERVEDGLRRRTLPSAAA